MKFWNLYNNFITRNGERWESPMSFNHNNNNNNNNTIFIQVTRFSLKAAITLGPVNTYPACSKSNIN